MGKPHVEDLSKLPKWARDRIERLERDLEGKRQELIRMGQPGQSFITMLLMPGEGPNELGLPDRTIRFRVAPGSRDYVEVAISRDKIHPRIMVRAQSQLVLKPEASNVIEVSSEGF